MVTLGLGLFPSEKVVESTAQMKYICTNVRRMGNKQDELEAMVHQEMCDIVAIKET